MSTTLLYLVRPGDHNPELQYSLRSIQRNLLLPDIRVAFVGYRPAWASPDMFLAGNRQSTSPMNVWDNVKIGSEWLASLGVEEYVLMNDDFFCLDPTSEVITPYRGTLDEHLALVGPNATNWWARSLRLTRDYLNSKGIEKPLSYDLHRPLPVKSADMAKVLAEAEADLDLSTGVPPQWRTVYGNMVGLEALQCPDVRMRRGQAVQFGSAWVSTSDETWRMHASMITKFLGEPSRWEKE